MKSNNISTSISQQTLVAHLFSQGIDAPINAEDGQYGLIDIDCLLSYSFRSLIRKHLQESVGDYEDNVANCNDFAEEAQSYIHYLHRKTIVKPVKCGAAFGKVQLIKDDKYKFAGKSGHKININVSRNADKVLEITFIDPQGWFVVDIPRELRTLCISSISFH